LQRVGHSRQSAELEPAHPPQSSGANAAAAPRPQPVVLDIDASAATGFGPLVDETRRRATRRLAQLEHPVVADSGFHVEIVVGGLTVDVENGAYRRCIL
jgi:hypothetical protein